MRKWRDLFTDRQLVALTTFSDLVGEARERVRQNATDAGIGDDSTPLRDGGDGAMGYAEGVGVYLALAVSKETVFLVTQARWRPGEWIGQHPDLADKHCRWFGTMQTLTLSLELVVIFSALLMGLRKLCAIYLHQLLAMLLRRDATTQQVSHDKLVSTDPPYYDNIGYADLSDFFYVWLRRLLGPVFPNLFATLAVPKAEELVATPYRHGSRKRRRDSS